MHQGGVPESSTSVPVFGGIGYGNGPIGEFFRFWWSGLILKRTLTHRFLDEQICDEKTAEKFGSLKAILEAVPVVYANESVRSLHCENYFDKRYFRELSQWGTRSKTSSRV